jgi:pyruvate-ferredoxin/flavodoxin oxidoreductase
LFRYNPLKEKGQRFSLDSKTPSIPLDDFLYQENRFSTIKDNYPEKALDFLAQAKEAMQQRWDRIELMRGL